MAKEGLSHRQLADATGLDDRTLRAVLHGDKQTRTSTLNKLASGLGIPVDDLFTPPTGMSPAAFDFATNPIVEETSAENPKIFEGWSGADFAELASRFGVGGALTKDGVLEAAAQLNDRRKLIAKACVVLESSHATLLSNMIDVLYERVTLSK